MESFLDGVDIFIGWMSTSLKQTTAAYCDIQTADSHETLVANDGSLLSIIRLSGVTSLVGREEFDKISNGLLNSLQAPMGRPGTSIQFQFTYDKTGVKNRINEILRHAKSTADRLELDLDDLFNEKLTFLSKYCSDESVNMVLWTKPNILTSDQLKKARKDQMKMVKEKNIPPFVNSQNILAAIPDMRETHDSLVKSVANDMQSLGLHAEVLEVHDALYEVRKTVDPLFTDYDWRPSLVGDKIFIKSRKKIRGDISDIMWPSLAKQLLPRDAENLNLRTARVGDQIYASMFIDLFPKEVQTFNQLFQRIKRSNIPWRMSFLIDSDGLDSVKLKSAVSAVLSFTSAQNRLLHDSINLLKYVELNTDDSVVKIRVSFATWAPDSNPKLLKSRAAQLSKAVQGWGSCDLSEVCGDPFAGALSSALAVSSESVATKTIAPLSAVVHMLPLFRPASPWLYGAMLFRSPDGKLWPYQPCSSEQTTWIDVIFARPGSGKSVLANAMNLGLCLSAGIERLPRIAIIDIGPSSSGLISLLQEALPKESQHLAAYYRLQMLPEYSINPFDTQLGCRYPTPQERSFLVNFLTLLATPVGSEKCYDGIADMAGMIVDELYKSSADGASPNRYSQDVDDLLDSILDEIDFIRDQQTTWWEVADALFVSGFVHEAMLAQRHAMPVLADAAAICRTTTVEDLYGKIVAPTGESLVEAFSRMISSAVREYPIISQITQFDIGDARVVSLDLDEVAKTGGDAADRQTAVMYMLARYALARHFYFTEDSVGAIPKSYRQYHRQRITEIREDQKRIVYDEFHRTSKVKAIRDQVIVDMREGRKWKVQIALVSQSLDDFDPVMIEFATSIFIMDSGPEQAIQKTAKIFGLSPTAINALRKYVHGPKEGGGTFLAQFSTKSGMNTQLLTNTLGPIELWAFSTTAEDVNLRNRLYKKIGPKISRRLLAAMYPSGSATRDIEQRMQQLKDDSGGLVDDDRQLGVIESVVDELTKLYQDDISRWT